MRTCAQVFSAEGQHVASSKQQGRSQGATSASSGTSAGTHRLIDYPRFGKTGFRRWLPSWRLVLGTVLTGGLLLVGLVVAAYAATTIPAPNSFAQAQTTTVRYANNDDGSPGQIMGTFATQQRQIVDTTTLPKTVGEAVVASEDSSFYQNSGVDPVGIARAFVNNIRGGARQGASTITEQYVENYYADKKASDYVGKLREALLAVKVNQSQDKGRVLNNYLNTIYFGRSTYGIQSAAQAYFGVDASALNVAQSALLVGIVPAPSNWDPAVDPAMAQQRWARVLDRMVMGGWLTPADRAKQVFPPTIKPVTPQTYQGPEGYLLNMVRLELKKDPAFTDSFIDTKGLNVETTIQQPVQAAAERAVASLRAGTLAGATPNPLMKVGVTTIDPADGAIVALYGGPDYITQSLNAVTQGTAQAGSTFKPFTLVAALENGVSLSKTYNGTSPQTLTGWGGGSVKNFGSGGGQKFGTINLVAATANSVNTVFAQLNLEVGPAKTAEVAKRAGVTSKVGTNPANVLGTDAVTPLEMADAYATFAAQGYHSDPFIVRQVTYINNGSIAYQAKVNREQVFKPDVMADVTYAMTQVVQVGLGKQWIKPLGRPIAGKTGTSSDNHSAWFIGFTPQLATAVAFYQPTADGKQDVITAFGKGVSQITGGTWPAALWAAYMKPVLALPKYATVVPFPKVANVNQRRATWTPGLRASAAPTSAPTAPATRTPVPQASAAPTSAPTAPAAPAPVPTPSAVPTAPTVPKGAGVGGAPGP